MTTHREAPDDEIIARAARRLLDGGLVAFPTETVYGLGADAENPAAVARIYQAKQRPSGHPLIVHLAPDADLSWWAGSVSSQAQALVDAFWPGPLTLILPRADHIPAAVSGGQPTIGLRCPAHPVAQALLTRFAAIKPQGQGGVAAPSANKFGHVSPTRATHVRAEFPELDDSELMILDGGASAVGIESTIIDVSDPAAVPAILRPGHISPEQIADVLGVMPTQAHKASPQVAGSLKAHYAPRTPLRLVDPERLEATLDALGGQGRNNAAGRDSSSRHGAPAREGGSRIAAMVFQAPATGTSSPGAGFPERIRDGDVDYYLCPQDARRYAQQLYGMLRSLDQQGYRSLIVERPPQSDAWRAVNDRLGRAAAAFET